MEKDVLKGVVEIEKEIRQRLEIEQEKAQKWLVKVKKEAEEEVLAKEFDLKEEMNRSTDSALSDARGKASGINDTAHRYSGHLKKISDDTLKKIILKYLPRILPGG